MTLPERSIAIIAGFLCAGILVVGGVWAQETPPNIVIILSDDQGWTETSVQMDPEIPDSRSDFYRTRWLEQLSAEGMRFSDAYASAPVCSPTRASLMTGKSSAQVQLTDIIQGGDVTTDRYWRQYTGRPLSSPLPIQFLPKDEVSLAERLHLATPEYRAGLFGKWHLAPLNEETPADHGFDSWSNGFSNDPPTVDPKHIFGVTADAIEFMEESVQQERPFFVILSHYAPHLPIQARPEIVEIYENMPPGDRHDDPEFAAMLHDLDNSVGLVLEAVDTLQIEDNTFIVYVSDNGGNVRMGFDENDPLYGSKASIFEGGLRVPMIVKGPGVEAGSVSPIPVVTHDLFTTASILSGVSDPLPQGVEGGDISPILFNGGQLPDGMDSIERAHAERGELFFHYPHYLTGGEAPHVPASAVRDGDYKLVRIYGEPGEDDTLLLFNLAENIEESADPDSPLNLADDMPELAAELNEKLEAWLQAVDAPFAYDVAAEIQLDWVAAEPGDDPDGWRSTIDVDYRAREMWTSGDDPNRPDNVEIPLHPLERAFRFDGDDVMTRKFFHVSDPKLPDEFDPDHSSTFEFWLRLDTLDQDHIIFESGGHGAGLSITIGDADGDTAHDDLRFRVLGEDGNHLTLTTPLDGVDPTAEFVQVVAVLDDSPFSRGASIYVNGDLRGHVEGVDGPDEINWDGFDDAGLGRTAGSGLGGAGGAGDQPFGGAGLMGDIALFRFNNHVIGPHAIRDRYFDVLARSAELVGFSVATGVVLEGGLPELAETDDAALRTRSGFGSSLADLHSMELVVDATTSVVDAETIDLLIESRIDEPAGSARVRLWNWETSTYDTIGQFGIGEIDDQEVLAGVAADGRVSESGQIRVSIEHVVHVPFLAFSFESWIDHVGVFVR